MAYFCHSMKLVRKIKQAAGGRFLRNEAEPKRERRGSNFNSAQRIGILYQDVDEPYFNKVKNYAKFLKDEFDIKSVICLGYVDEVKKKLPAWQLQKLELNFFSREDLNWHYKPVQNVATFLQEDFDMLIDLSGGNVVPLNYVMKESKARMKVGLKGSRTERYCDFLLNMGEAPSTDKFIEQLNLYLSNPKIK